MTSTPRKSRAPVRRISGQPISSNTSRDGCVTHGRACRRPATCFLERRGQIRERPVCAVPSVTRPRVPGPARKGTAGPTGNRRLLSSGPDLLRSHVLAAHVTLVIIRIEDPHGAVDVGAWRQHGTRESEPIKVRNAAAAPLRVVGSRSHPSGELGEYLARLGPHVIKPMGSSLKICLVAEGAADLYPRFGPTSEWDTAAAQAILESAGGRMMDRVGQPLRYNTKDDLLNPHFLAFGDTRRNWLAPIQTTRGSENRN